MRMMDEAPHSNKKEPLVSLLDNCVGAHWRPDPGGVLRDVSQSDEPID